VFNLLVREGKANVNVDLACTDGSTPLFTASRHGLLKIVQCLVLEGKANADKDCGMGATALIIAA
jgi:ankyrin repeat protein